MGELGELLANIFAPGISSEIISTLKDKFYSTNPRFMSGKETILYLEFLGQNFRPFLILFITVSFIKVYKDQRHRSLKKKYNLDDILKVGSQYNPHLNPVICQDLVKSDPDIGPLARDKSPLILAIENNLITVFDIDHIGNNTNRILTPVFGLELEVFCELLNLRMFLLIILMKVKPILIEIIYGIEVFIMLLLLVCVDGLINILGLNGLRKKLICKSLCFSYSYLN